MFQTRMIEDHSLNGLLKTSKILNVLINNAGIQRAIDLKTGIKGLEGQNEIKINLEATIYLSALFIPFLESKEKHLLLMYHLDWL